MNQGTRQYQDCVNPIFPDDVIPKFGWYMQAAELEHEKPINHAARAQAYAAPTKPPIVVPLLDLEWPVQVPDVIRPPVPISLYQARAPPSLLPVSDQALAC